MEGEDDNGNHILVLTQRTEAWQMDDMWSWVLLTLVEGKHQFRK